MLGQRNPKFDLATALSRSQIVILNLARGVIGDTSSKLLGGLFTTYLHQHLTARDATKLDECPPFNVIVDEFQLLGCNSIFRDLISSSRKRGARMVIAHQNLTQIDERLRHEILSNVGSIAAFQLGADDAETLAPELGVDNHVYLADREPSIARLKRRFVATTEWIECADRWPSKNRAPTVIDETRRRFGRRRELIERDFRISDAERTAAARRASTANGARNR